MAIIGSADKMLTLHTLHQISKNRCVISLKQKCSFNSLATGVQNNIISCLLKHKQTCGFQLQFCLSMYELLVDTRRSVTSDQMLHKNQFLDN